MKRLKRWICLLVGMALIFTMSPATIFADSEDITEETETVDIVKSRTIMCVDCSLKLKEEHFLDNLTWESSDTSIATVSQDGEVKALKPGTVTITASNSNSSDTCSVVVEDYAYLGGKDDRTLHRNHPEATTQYVRVYAYTSTNGEDIVLTYINYELITNWDLYTLHNMTTGSVIQDPEDYYEDLYDRAFGANKFSILDDSLDLSAAKIEITKGNCRYYDPDEEREESSSEESSSGDSSTLSKGVSAEAAEKAITSAKTDKDLKGSVYNKLQVRQSKATKSSITIKWQKVSGAKKYVVFAGKSGKSNKLQKITTTTKTNYTLKKFNKKKLTKGTYYKFAVVALNSKGKVVSASKFAHIATLGKNSMSNPAKVTTKAKNDKVTIKAYKSFKLAGSYASSAKKFKIKKILGMRYESTNTKVATVSSKGVIKGVKKGTCYVYAYAQNGIAKKIKVVVKSNDASISVEPSSVSLKVGGRKKVTVTVKNVETINVGSGSTASCEWGDWNGDTIPLYIIGNEEGECEVVVFDDDNRNIEAVINVTVY